MTDRTPITPAIPPVYAVVPAAGIGRRMSKAAASTATASTAAMDGVPKQYYSLLGKTVLEHTLDKLLSVPGLCHIVLVVARGDKHLASLPLINDSRISVVTGGAERCHSVLNGLQNLATRCGDSDWVLVHDAARPCVKTSDIVNLLGSVRSDPIGGILALPVSDTLKSVVDNAIADTVDRSQLWQAQTPQLFRYRALADALRDGIANGLLLTDEASALEAAGARVSVVEGCRSNIKITRPEDLALAEFYLSEAQLCE